MPDRCDLLWVGQTLDPATPGGAIARAILSRLTQTYRLDVVAVEWMGGARMLYHFASAEPAPLTAAACAELQPRVVVTCGPAGEQLTMMDSLTDVGGHRVAFVEGAAAVPRATVRGILRRADAVIAATSAGAEKFDCEVLGLGVDPDCFRPLMARRALRAAVGLGAKLVVGYWAEELELPRGLELLRWLGATRTAGQDVALLLALEPEARHWQYGDYAKRLGLGASFREIGDLWQRGRDQHDATLNELLNLMDLLVVGSRSPETAMIAVAAASAGVAVVSASEWLAEAADLPHLGCLAHAEQLEHQALLTRLAEHTVCTDQLRLVQQAGREWALRRSWDELTEQWHQLLAPLLSREDPGRGTLRTLVGVGPRLAKPPATGRLRPARSDRVSEASAQFNSCVGPLPDEHTKPSVAILTPAFYNPTLACGGDLPIMGGAERYLLDLAGLLQHRGYHVDAFQPSPEPWRRCYDDLNVYGLGVNDVHYDTHPGANRVFHEVTAAYDHLIYHTFAMCYPRARPGSIAISHGIWWDATGPEWWRSEEWRHRMRASLGNVGTLVSVDTNTLNWVRAEHPDLSHKLHYLANGVDLERYCPATPRQSEKPLTVLFPRQLVWGRGFGMMLDLAHELVAMRDDLRFLFVGRGGREAETQLQATARECPRISWTWHRLDDMPEVYRSADITVIPSLASEGTSLSCLEAMASGNAVVATNVGGLGNLIVDGYNGLLVDPHPDAVRRALLRLAEDDRLRLRLSERALATARCFSRDRWNRAWGEVMDASGMPVVSGIDRTSQRAQLSAPVVLVVSLAPWGMTGGGQRPQKLAEAFANRGFSVIYLQNYPGPTLAPAHGIRLLNYADLVPGGFHGAANNLDENACRRLWDACRKVAEARPVLALFSACTPAMVALARQLKASRVPVVYDALDDWEAFRQAIPAHWYQAEAEQDFLRTADRVTAVTPVLADRLSAKGAEVGASPNAADWRMVVAPHSVRPPDLPRRRGPVVGYVGSLAGEWHDWELVAHLALARPRWQFVLIGPGGEKLPEWLTSLANVTVLPLKPQNELVGYIDAFDIGIIPFMCNRLTCAVSPIKAYDYLARGCPVVSSPMSGLDDDMPLVSVAQTADDWLPLMEAALSSPHRRPLCWLWGNTWDARVAAYLHGHPLLPPAPAASERVLQRLSQVRLRPDGTSLHVHWEMPHVVPYRCHYCGDRHKRCSHRPPVSHARIEECWERFTAQHDRCQIDVSGPDPLGDERNAALLGHLTATHLLVVHTGLSFPPEALVHVSRPKNMLLYGAFDPRRETEDEVASTIRSLRDQGVAVPWLRLPSGRGCTEDLSRRRDRFAELGTQLVMWQSRRGSQRKPGAGCADSPPMPPHTRECQHGSLSPRGALCATGWQYAVVRADGTFCRCPSGLGDLGGLNFYEDDLLLRDHPSTCDFDACLCEQVWGYQLSKQEKLAYLGAAAADEWDARDGVAEGGDRTAEGG